MGQASFGLTPDDVADVLLEPFFLRGYYFGMDWNTYYTYPVAYKRWLIERIGEEIKKANEKQSDIPSKGMHHNTPDIRTLAGKSKSIVNPKSQRFT